MTLVSRSASSIRRRSLPGPRNAADRRTHRACAAHADGQGRGGARFFWRDVGEEVHVEIVGEREGVGEGRAARAGTEGGVRYNDWGNVLAIERMSGNEQGAKR